MRYVWLMGLFLLSSCHPVYLDYKDISNENYILWEEILNFPFTYYVYIFSHTCPHCERIKDKILSFFMHRDSDTFYLVEGTKEIPKTNTPIESIGKSKLEDIAIQGYPTLMQMEEQEVKMLWTGESEIISYITPFL